MKQPFNSMGRSRLSEIVQNQVRDRARGLCEYCHAIECWQYVKFTIDHIIPRSRGGSDTLNNLALACFNCNRKKSNHINGVDPQFQEIISLFHPRQHQWSDHFVWASDGISLVDLSAIGRITITQLEMNRERVLQIRAADRAIGRHPPQGDRILEH
jgi:5-methylcytosine-specific restriction endonuclease McrA